MACLKVNFIELNAMCILGNSIQLHIDSLNLSLNFILLEHNFLVSFIAFNKC